MGWAGWMCIIILGGNLLFFGGLYVWMAIDEWMERRNKHEKRGRS